MKKILVIAVLIMLSSQFFAQAQQGGRNRTRPAAAPLAPPLPSREVSGIVKDESGQTIIGALVTLKSKTDTLRTSTNDDGVFILRDVKQATFIITYSSIGSETITKKYLNSDITPKIILDPIILKSKTNELSEVKINGTPSITYKTDTIEYKASDYHVRENSTLDELLKKMEGFEVGSDGSLTHQGQTITKAKLNGKEYAGGDVAQAIQNLPADIIEKVQVVDDYGDQAARTGIKDGDPQKILNVTTRDDRSVGTTGRLTAQAGNDDRYNAQLFVQRINANQQLGVIGNLRNSITGVASTGVQGGATNGGGGGAGVGGNARGGSPGTSQTGSPSFNYRDQWSKKVQVNSSYAYSFTNNNSTSKSYGTTNTSLGTGAFNDQSINQNNRNSHTVHFQMDVDLDSANFLQITPNYSYSNSTQARTSIADNTNNYTTGFEHVVSTGSSSSATPSTSYGLTAFYLHVFKKPHRNFSIQVSANHSNSQSNGGSDKDYKYYALSPPDSLLKDSAINTLTFRTNKNTTYQATVTYVEPLSLISQIEFSGNIRQSNNNSKAIQDSVLANGQLKDLTAYDNIFNYTTTQSRATLNYRYNGTKVNLTLGATAIPYNLNGTKVDENVGQNVSTSRSYFRVVPAFRFAYIWSRTERFQITYSGNNSDPSFAEIQPFTDRSDPKNIKIGNPDLRPGFSNSINASYNDYIANSKFNISFNANYTSVDNSITTNTVQLRVPLTVNPTDPSKNTFQNINETNYINLSGAHSIVGRYNISKQLDDRRYNFALNGNVTYSYTPAMSNNVLYHLTDWRFDERFGPRINPTDNIEFNPYVGYDLDRSFTTSLNAKPTYYRTIQLAVDGKMYFLQTFQVNYSAHKIFVSGIANSTNPLVINAGFQKEFLKKKNLVFTFDIYDLLHQNNFIQQTVTATSVTNTVSNSLSRYFMFGMRLNLQKWSGRPMRNGRAMQRRGDGSFIYN